VGQPLAPQGPGSAFQHWQPRAAELPGHGRQGGCSPGGGSSSSSSSGWAGASSARSGDRGTAALLASLALAVLPRSASSRRGLFAGRSRGRGRRARVTAAGAQRQQTKQKKVQLTDLPQGTDFYGVLGVERDATQEEIRAAYKRLIRTTHPDINPSPEATEVFIQAQEAFRWLSDPQQREVYDGVGGKFGEDAIYDYTDEPILGSLDQIKEIEQMNPAIDLVNRCRKEITWKKAIQIDTHVKDIRARFRKYGAQRVCWVRDYLCKELNRVLAYPRLIRRLHPFERLSVELSLTLHRQNGGVAFGQALSVLKALKRRISEEAAARANACSKAPRGRLATFIADAAIQDMWELVESHEPVFQQFRACQVAVLKAPCIDLDKPTVVFVGAPNVGKSSLVRSVSTGRPEVNDYLFTTKQLTIGHLWHFIAGTPLLIHGQIVDSPGLRGPPGTDHNLLDQMTMGAMEHLPTGVVFVFDPYPLMHGLLTVDDQVKLRETLRNKFPRRPWIDVITKVDLEEPEAQEAMDDLLQRYPDAVMVSALEGTGLAELNTEVRRLLEEMTRVVRQLQRSKIRQLRMGATESPFVGKEALSLR